MKGEVTIFPLGHRDRPVYHRKNVICNTSSFLFARLMSNSAEPVAGVWGLALGAGGSAPAWSASVQPDPTATQTTMVSEIKRKQLQQVQYLDSNGNPTTTLTTSISLLTVLNSTTDGISLAIREMGLIGGGTTTVADGGPTNMLTAPYFDPTNPQANSVILINYITTPPFLLPQGVDMGVEWVLAL